MEHGYLVLNHSLVHDLNSSALLSYSTTTPFDKEKSLYINLGNRRAELISVIILIVVYSCIFISGVIGNLCTCIVIWRNPYMHTVTNYYLFNLAVSDVLTLLLALPPEVYSIWESYPWRFGEAFCILKSFIMEVTSYSSVLTITGFTLERYFAICHPIKTQECCSSTRAARCITLIWAISVCSALPYPINTRLFYYLYHPVTGKPVPESLVCNIPKQWSSRMFTVFQLSSFFYFILPLIIITLLYVLIGLKLRQTELNSYNSPQFGKATAARARRAVLKMLVAVVAAFFLCWAPFHAQRLMTLFIKDWTTELLNVHTVLFFISGVLYFFSSTVNPILYNLLSRKFRKAFKRTLCRCCCDINSIPTFYKLKAIFNHNDLAGASVASNPSCHNDIGLVENKKAVRLVTYYRNVKATHGSCDDNIIEQGSTRDTVMNKTSRGSSCSSHAHSDGGLHYLCRYKSCNSRRQALVPPRPACHMTSYQDIESLRKNIHRQV